MERCNSFEMIKYDYLASAIEKGYANTGVDELKNSWNRFDTMIKGKKLFLFGAGNGLSHLMYFYHKKYFVEAIIDNDPEIIDQNIKQFMWTECAASIKDKKIRSIEILEKVDKNDIVVLITSLRAYEKIYKQIKKIQVNNVFSLLLMEAIEKKYCFPSFFNCAREEKMSNEVASISKLSRNRIVFYMDYFYDHGRYVTKILLHNDELEIVWIVKKYTKAPKRVRQILTEEIVNTIEMFETAKVIVAATIMPNYYLKREGQTYIQIKHWGSVTLKKFFLDATFFNQFIDVVNNWKEDTKKMDYIITGSEFDTETCKSGFGFTGDFLEFGSCRSDAMFFGEKNRKLLCEQLGIEKDSFIVIYAPTYRWQGKGMDRKQYDYLPDFNKIKSNLHNKDQKMVVLLRLHPALENAINQVKLSRDMVDVSDYYDSQILISASDIMITDYSSIMFEMSYIKKPVFLFAPDYDEYRENDYEFLIDYSTLPFPIAKDSDELMKNIRDFNSEKYAHDVTDFLKRYGVHEDGHASERVAKFIKSLVSSEVSQ